MGGRMTATLNSNGDVCAIQKAGGEAILQGVIMQCLRIAAAKAGAISDMIKKEVDSYNTKRALLKIKRHSTPRDVDRGASDIGLKQNSSVDQMRVDEFSGHHVQRIKQECEEGIAKQSRDVESETKLSDKTQTNRSNEDTKNFIGGPSSWDPYSVGVDSDSLKASLASQGMQMPIEKQKDSKGEETRSEAKPEDAPENNNPKTSPLREAESAERANGEKTLKDAVKAKNRKSRRKSHSSSGPS